jgi:hypothetical protein
MVMVEVVMVVMFFFSVVVEVVVVPTQGMRMATFSALHPKQFLQEGAEVYQGVYVRCAAQAG